MRFFTAASALVAFAASAIAQEFVATKDFAPVLYPSEEWQTFAAGSTLNIKWQHVAKYTGTLSIHLIGGKTQPTQQKLDVPVVDNVPNSDGGYAWKIPADIEKHEVYGLVLTWDKDTAIFQYSFPFHVGQSGDKNDDKEDDDKTDYPIPTESGSDYEITSHVTKEYGTKTVILSSTFTSTICTTSEVTSETPVTISYITPNTTIHYAPPTEAPVHETTLVTKPVEEHPTYAVPSPAPIPTEPVVPSPVPTAAAGRFTAGTAALVGGLVIAIFAL